MKHIKTFINIVVMAGAFALAVPAQADSTKHTWMDLEAAKRDARQLEHDREMARRHHDWKKVAQDDRLIAQDLYWIHKDERKLERDERHHRY